MVPSEKCYALVKHFEGLYLTAYACPAGIPTIGYGTTGYINGEKIIVGKTTCTKEEAEDALKRSLESFAKRVDLLVPVGITQDQFDALVSWCYNLGVGNFVKSTLLKKLRAGDIEGAGQEILRWNKAKVKGVLTELPGLTRRRQAESHLFLTGELPPLS